MTHGNAETPRVSIIVLNYNGRDHLEHCLPSLMELEFPREQLEILVVDNGSTDGSPDVVRGFAPRVELVPCGTNLGFAAGNNLGAGRAGGELLAFLNNDTKVEPGWLDSLCRTSERDGGVAAVAGKILNWDGTRLDFGCGIMTFDGHAFQKDSGLDCESDPYCSVTETFIPCGGNMLIRRSIFEDLGGFDDDFFAYLEDVDLAWRLWGAGHRVLFDPDAVVFHRSAGTSGRMDPFHRGFLFERNAFMTAFKNLDEEYFPKVFPAIVMTLLSRTLNLAGRVADRDGLLTRYPYTGDGYRRDMETGQHPDAGEDERKTAKDTIKRIWNWLVPKGDAVRRQVGPEGQAPAQSLTIDHPHSISQLQAVNYIFDNLDTLMAKREAVQAVRKVPDRDIFSRFPLHLVPTYPGDEPLFATRFFRWLLGAEVRPATLEEIHHSDE